MEVGFRMRDELRELEGAGTSDGRVTDEHLWIMGYCDGVVSYLPSAKVLAEGGYEGCECALWQGFPSRWAPGCENRLAQATRRLAVASAGDARVCRRCEWVEGEAA